MALETLSATASNFEPDAPERQRTVLIWLIVAFVGIGVVMTPITLWTTRASYVKYPVGLLVFALIGLAVQAAGAIALFRLRASAVRIFALSLAVGLASSVYGLVTVDPSNMVIPAGLDEATFRAIARGSQIWGIVFGFLFYGGILLYLKRLQKRGMLQ